MRSKLYNFDNQYRKDKNYLIAGIDEVGRGCLAGPLVVACCILKIDFDSFEINDSKKISEAKREKLYKLIIENCIDYHIEVIDPITVDNLNPKKSSILGMEISLKNIKTKPDIALIDYEKINSNIKTVSITKGDSKSLSIAAASILAKVFRDRIMKELHKKYPDYDFESNKGYGTKKHIEAIIKNKPIKNIHRFSYKIIKELKK